MHTTRRELMPEAAGEEQPGFSTTDVLVRVARREAAPEIERISGYSLTDRWAWAIPDSGPKSSNGGQVTCPSAWGAGLVCHHKMKKPRTWGGRGLKKLAAAALSIRWLENPVDSGRRAWWAKGAYWQPVK